MITKDQLKILGIFKKELVRSLSLSDLKRELGESSNSKLQKAILKFKEEGLINIKRVGRTNLISLNFDNNKLFHYLAIYDFESIGKKMPLDIIYDIQKVVLKETEFFSLIVFGSYASGNIGKKSDLDIAIVVENGSVKKNIIPLINSIKRKELREIDEHIFTRGEFLEMLGDEKENLGKEIVRNHVVFYGMINFYKLVLRGVKHVEFS